MNCIKMFIGYAMAAAALLPTLACSQDRATKFPSKPIHVVVPFSPGGVTELEARLYANKLSENLKAHPVVVEFKPGAGSTVGAAYVAKAPPDGHTLLVISGAFAISPQSVQEFAL